MNIRKLLDIKPNKTTPHWVIYKVLPTTNEYQVCYVTSYSILDGELVVKITKYIRVNPKVYPKPTQSGQIMWTNRRVLKLEPAVYALLKLRLVCD